MTTPRMAVALAVVLLAAVGVGTAGAEGATAARKAHRARKEPRMSFQLTSTAFRANEGIPAAHTCEGTDVAPALAWTGAPAGTKSFALIVDDPDAPDPAAPKMTWVHWVLYDIPAAVASLAEGVTADSLPAGAREGLNDWKQPGWRGPCPPVGRHRYFFKLYALDAPLGDLGTPAKARLEQAMKGHVLAEARLLGTYEKKRL